MSEQTGKELAVTTQPQPRGSMVPRSFDELWQMAVSVAESRLFGVDNPAQAVTLMMLAEAENLHPIQALRMYHIIKGKPSMRSEAMQARFQSRGGFIRWIERSRDRVSAEFSHPSLQPEPILITWDDARVKEARLGGADSNHAKFPIQMKAARVVSEGVNAIMPEVKLGMYTPEEVQDFAPPSGTQPRREQSAASDFIEGEAFTKTADPDAEFLAAWDDASDAHGIPRGRGRAIMAAAFKNRQVSGLKEAPEAVRVEVINGYRNADAEAVEKMKGTKKADAPVEKQPVEGNPAEPPITDDLVKDYNQFVDLCFTAGANHGVDLGKLDAGIVKFRAARTDDKITVAERKVFLQHARDNQVDWDTGKIVKAKK